MKLMPAYKSIKVTFQTWQALTRISARTGEPRTEIIERLASAEERALEGSQQSSTDLGDKGAIEKE